MRRVLDERGFVEFEGPMLQLVAGGANARPFTTHHHALDIDMKLRIALELYLKRMLVGGAERVFELGRNFRNEGIDRDHNPEFTMLEAYQAYGDYHTMMELSEALVVECARAVNPIYGRDPDDLTVTIDGRAIDLTPPFERLHDPRRGERRRPARRSRSSTHGPARRRRAPRRRRSTRRSVRARSCRSCSRSSWRARSSGRRSCATSRARSRRSRARTATTPA